MALWIGQVNLWSHWRSTKLGIQIHKVLWPLSNIRDLKGLITFEALNDNNIIYCTQKLKLWHIGQVRLTSRVMGGQQNCAPKFINHTHWWIEVLKTNHYSKLQYITIEILFILIYIYNTYNTYYIYNTYNTVHNCIFD